MQKREKESPVKAMSMEEYLNKRMKIKEQESAREKRREKTPALIWTYV